MSLIAGYILFFFIQLGREREIPVLRLLKWTLVYSILAAINLCLQDNPEALEGASETSTLAGWPPDYNHYPYHLPLQIVSLYCIKYIAFLSPDRSLREMGSS